MFVSTQFGDSNFYQLLAGCKESLKLVLPRITNEDVGKMLDLKQASTELQVVTGYEITDFFYQKTDLVALHSLVDSNSAILGMPGLSGSFCLFDSEKAIVNSGPITREGFGASRNYGIIVDNKQVVHTLQEDYKTLLEQPGIRKIDARRLLEIEEALAKLTGTANTWKWNPERTSRELGLTGWTLAVFDCLLKIPNNEFVLAEVYAYASMLSREYPLNNHVEAKIRQQLQVLRDKKLVEFGRRGHYRKLSGLAGL